MRVNEQSYTDGCGIMIDGDDNGANMFCDYTIHETGDFDLITARWIHHQVVVDGANSFQVYVDGQRKAVGWSNPTGSPQPPAYGAFTLAADKFEEEEIHELELLPPVWTERSETDREKWIKIIDEDGASWDVDMINKLREADMPLPIVVNIFKTPPPRTRTSYNHNPPRGPTLDST